MHDLSPTTFGLWAMDDSRFVFDLRNGRRCYNQTRARVCRFMEEYEKRQEDRRLRIRGHQSETRASIAPEFDSAGAGE